MKASSGKPSSSNHQSGPSRREFVQRSTAAAAALVAAPTLLLPKRTGWDQPVVGEGEHRCECQHKWGELPAGHHYGDASHGVCIDKNGCFYISHQGKPGSIFVFDPDGKFIKSLAPEFEGNGHGIDIREENGQEFLYLSPAFDQNGFAKIDLNGEWVWRKPLKVIQEETGLYKEKMPFRPTNTSFAPDGGFFLGDGYGSNLIHQYDKDAKYVRSIGGTGQADGQFQTPHGQWLDARDGKPKLAVCDRANKRLQFFDMNGKFLSKLDGFLFPADIDIRGDLMVVPDLHCRVTLLDKSNKVVAQLGDDPQWREQALAGFKMRGTPAEWRPGKFVHPHDACFDHQGNIMVTEWVTTGRVTKLRKV
jgi:hypothetical protein